VPKLDVLEVPDGFFWEPVPSPTETGSKLEDALLDLDSLEPKSETSPALLVFGSLASFEALVIKLPNPATSAPKSEPKGDGFWEVGAREKPVGAALKFVLLLEPKTELDVVPNPVLGAVPKLDIDFAGAVPLLNPEVDDEKGVDSAGALSMLNHELDVVPKPDPPKIDPFGKPELDAGAQNSDGEPPKFAVVLLKPKPELDAVPNPLLGAVPKLNVDFEDAVPLLNPEMSLEGNAAGTVPKLEDALLDIGSLKEPKGEASKGSVFLSLSETDCDVTRRRSMVLFFFDLEAPNLNPPEFSTVHLAPMSDISRLISFTIPTGPSSSSDSALTVNNAA
jgi:hypothetical protein